MYLRRTAAAAGDGSRNRIPNISHANSSNKSAATQSDRDIYLDSYLISQIDAVAGLRVRSLNRAAAPAWCGRVDKS